MNDTPAFQPIQNAVFDKTIQLYGQQCTWKKTGGDVVDSVLFNDPTDALRFQIVAGRGLAHVGYNNGDVIQPYIEYREGQFSGLFELVYNKDVNQYLIIRGVKYVTIKTSTFFDGQTYKVFLNKSEIDNPIDGQ